MLAVFAFPSDAMAKGKGKGKGKGGKKGKGDVDIMLTGFKSIDKVFKEVADIDARLDRAEEAMKSAKHNLNLALSLEKGTPLKDAIEDLKVKGGDQLQVVMKGKAPQLTVADAAPSNVVQAATAVNEMTSSLVTSIEDLAGIPDEIKQMTKAIEALPSRAKDEFTGDPIGALLKAPKLIKSIKGNTQVTASIPDRSVDVSKRAASMVSLVSTTFVPGGGPGAASERPLAQENDSPRDGARSSETTPTGRTRRTQ